MSRITRDRISFSSSTTPTYVEQAMHASVRKVSLSRKSFTTPSKKSHEEESPVKPDSTTESRKVMHNFQEGDDVFYENTEGQSVLGTVSKVSANTCLVSFDDGTEQWAACKRLRKLGDPEEELSNKFVVEETAARCVEKVLKKTEKIKLTCIGCKCGNEISPSKANGSRVQFRCLKCEGGLVSQDFVTLTQTKVLENYVKQTKTVTSAGAHGQLAGHHNREDPRSLISPNSQTVSKSLKSAAKSGGLTPKSGIQGKRVGNEITIMNYFKPALTTSVQSTVNPEIEECFHCKGATVQFQRVSCKMCSRFCHLFCLQLQPTPMGGDRFWDVMCATCGTQNGSGGSITNRIFSVRRNISSWADIAQLLINCMSAKSLDRENSFALKSQILPFMKKYNDVLHLPRMYKQSPDQQREMNLLAALTTSTWRFVKKFDQHGSEPLWSLAPEFDKEVPSKKKSNDNTRTSSGKGANNRIVQGSPKTQANISGSLNGTMQVPGVKSSAPALTTSQSPNPVNGNILHKSSGVVSQNSQTNFSSSAASRLLQSSPRRGLSIIPIPKPGSDSSEYSSESTGYSADDMKISVTSSKVQSKEMLLRQPIVTNIILSPTTSPVYGFVDPKSCRTATSESPKRSMVAPNTPKTLAPGKPSVYQVLNGHETPIRNFEQRLESTSVSNAADSSIRKRSVPVGFNETGSNIKRPRLLDSVPSDSSPHELDVNLGRKPKRLRSSLKKNKISTTPSQQAANALKVKAAKGKLGKKSSVSPSSVVSNDADEDPEFALMDAHDKLPANQSARRTRRFARANHLKASGVVAIVVPSDEPKDPEEEAHKQWQESLLDAIVYGGLRPRCLPRKRLSGSLFDDNEPPDEENIVSDTDSINSATENMNSLVTKKAELWKPMEDPSTYSIAATRVGSSGETEYLVVWHETRETAKPSGFFAEMERILFPDGVPPQHPFLFDDVEEDEDESMDVEVEVGNVPEKVTETIVPLKAANGSVSTSALAQKLTSNYKVDSSNASVVLRSNSLFLVPGGDGSSHIFDIGIN